MEVKHVDSSLDSSADQKYEEFAIETDCLQTKPREREVEILEEIRKDGLNVNANDFILQSVVSKSVSFVKTMNISKKDFIGGYLITEPGNQSSKTTEGPNLK